MFVEPLFIVVFSDMERFRIFSRLFVYTFLIFHFTFASRCLLFIVVRNAAIWGRWHLRPSVSRPNIYLEAEHLAELQTDGTTLGGAQHTAEERRVGGVARHRARLRMGQKVVPKRERINIQGCGPVPGRPPRLLPPHLGWVVAHSLDAEGLDVILRVYGPQALNLNDMGSQRGVGCQHGLDFVKA